MSEAKDYQKYLHLLDEANHYKVLGVNENSSLDDITREYRSLAKKFHPDMHPTLNIVDKQKLGQLFQLVNASFNILKDQDKRSSFDKDLEFKRRKAQIIPPVITPEIKISNSNPSPKVENLDTRTKGGFTFTKLVPVDIDKIRADKERKDKEAAQISFDKAKKLITENKMDEAIAILRSLTEKFSSISDYHSYLGLAMQEKGWHGYAQAEFKVALYFNSNDPIALKNYKPSAKAQEKAENKTTEGSSVVGKFKSFFNRK